MKTTSVLVVGNGGPEGAENEAGGLQASADLLEMRLFGGMRSLGQAVGDLVSRTSKSTDRFIDDDRAAGAGCGFLDIRHSVIEHVSPITWHAVSIKPQSRFTFQLESGSCPHVDAHFLSVVDLNLSETLYRMMTIGFLKRRNGFRIAAVQEERCSTREENMLGSVAGGMQEIKPRRCFIEITMLHQNEYMQCDVRKYSGLSQALSDGHIHGFDSHGARSCSLRERDDRSNTTRSQSNTDIDSAWIAILKHESIRIIFFQLP
jgi:hypothetical protein